MKKILFCMLVMIMITALFMSTRADAALINKGTDTLSNRLIYDDDLGITWYDFSNTPDIWDNQVSWADDLSINFGGNIYEDWRLPTTVDDASSFGYNKTNSEMGHLYYTELGNSVGGPLSNTGDFQNLISSVY